MSPELKEGPKRGFRCLPLAAAMALGLAGIGVLISAPVRRRRRRRT